MATIQGQLNTPRDSTFQTTESTSRNLADVLADELSGIAQAIADGGSTDYDDLTHRPEINSVTLTGDKSADDLSLAMQEDLTSIKATGTTNATGSTITSGIFFYLNGTLCKAKSDIANGATFTLNTNYEVVTAGGLNSLNSAIVNVSGRLTQTDAKVLGIESSLGNGSYANTGYASFNVDITSAWGGWYQSPVISITLGGDYRNKRVEYSVISDNYSIVPSAIITSTGVEITLFRPTSATGVTGKVYVRAFN